MFNPSVPSAPPPMGGMPMAPPTQAFPSLNPQMVAQAAQPLAAIQEQDQLALQNQQNSLLAMILSMLKQQPNPAGQAAMTMPQAPQAPAPGTNPADLAGGGPSPVPMQGPGGGY